MGYIYLLTFVDQNYVNRHFFVIYPYDIYGEGISFCDCWPIYESNHIRNRLTVNVVPQLPALALLRRDISLKAEVN